MLSWQEVAKREQGGPQFRYTVRRQDGSVTVETPDTDVVLVDLSPDREYIFSLTATNSLGSSMAIREIIVPAHPPSSQPEGVITVYQGPVNYSITLGPPVPGLETWQRHHIAAAVQDACTTWEYPESIVNNL